MSFDRKSPSQDPTANRRIQWWVFLAALVWGLMIGLGAFLRDPLRGLFVFLVVLGLAGLWSLLLLHFERKRQASIREQGEADEQDGRAVPRI